MKHTIILLLCLFSALAQAQTASSDSSAVRVIIEEAPRYPGGTDAMNKFFMENMKYPKKSVRRKVQGKVFVQFVIEKDGSVSDVLTIKGPDPLLNAEGERVVRLMPRWIPGKQDGKAVRVRYVVPLNFAFK